MNKIFYKKYTHFKIVNMINKLQNATKSLNILLNVQFKYIKTN